jgi:hypothetical protein
MLDRHQKETATRRLRAINHVVNEPHRFRPDFKAYLIDNWNVYAEFERRALHVSQHRAHYAARTIIEVIRHESAVGELFGEYKINNNQIPDLARLFALMNQHHSTLFEFREHKAAA